MFKIKVITKHFRDITMLSFSEFAYYRPITLLILIVVCFPEKTLLEA